MHLAFFLLTKQTFAHGSDEQWMVLIILWCMGAVWAVIQHHKAVKALNVKTVERRAGYVILYFLLLIPFSLAGGSLFITIALNGAIVR